MATLRVLLAAMMLMFTLSSAHAANDASALLQWDLQTIGAQQAWSQGADGHGISVLVIDTGLDKVEATTVLSGSILPSMSVNPLHGETQTPCPSNDFTGGPCYKAVLQPNPSSYIDTVGHGSFVVSEIVASGKQYGYWGVAPKAKAAMAKVFIDGGAHPNDIAQAIDWGVIHHFQIISMSLGGNDDPVMGAAVARAVAAGVLVVAATGNSSAAIAAYPAAYPGVIAVGSTDRWNKVAYYSNGGATIAAPGDWVLGIGPMHPTRINCGGLCTWEGTSMATPHVAGALADLLSWGLSTQDAKAVLYGGAAEAPKTTYFGAGILSITGSMRWAAAHHLPRH